MCYSPAHESVNNNDCQHDTNPFAGVSSTIPILLQHSLPINFTLGSQCALVHTVTPFAAVIGSMTEFVDHHTSENVSLLRGVRPSLLGVKGTGSSRSRYNGKHISKMDSGSLARPESLQHSSTGHLRMRSELKRRRILGRLRT